MLQQMLCGRKTLARTFRTLTLPLRPKPADVRFFIELAYFGEAYCGWQIQPNGTSVQETLEKAIGLLARRPVSVVGQGRTDSGVHALQSFAHFETDTLPFPPEQWVFKINGVLPHDIAVKRIVPVAPDAHARFSATGRSYTYLITKEKDPFLYKRAWGVYRPLDTEAMRNAAAFLLGRHDFTSFSSARSDTEGRVCHVTQLDITETATQIRIDIGADRFVMNMVRTITGTLAEVGLGKRNAADMARLLLEKDRRKTGENAPAHALYLREVKYPEHIFKL